MRHADRADDLDRLRGDLESGTAKQRTSAMKNLLELLTNSTYTRLLASNSREVKWNGADDRNANPAGGTWDDLISVVVKDHVTESLDDTTRKARAVQLKACQNLLIVVEAAERQGPVLTQRTVGDSMDTMLDVYDHACQTEHNELADCALTIFERIIQRVEYRDALRTRRSEELVGMLVECGAGRKKAAALLLSVVRVHTCDIKVATLSTIFQFCTGEVHPAPRSTAGSAVEAMSALMRRYPVAAAPFERRSATGVLTWATRQWRTLPKHNKSAVVEFILLHLCVSRRSALGAERSGLHTDDPVLANDADLLRLLLKCLASERSLSDLSSASGGGRAGRGGDGGALVLARTAHNQLAAAAAIIYHLDRRTATAAAAAAQSPQTGRRRGSAAAAAASGDDDGTDTDEEGGGARKRARAPSRDERERASGAATGSEVARLVAAVTASVSVGATATAAGGRRPAKRAKPTASGARATLPRLQLLVVFVAAYAFPGSGARLQEFAGLHVELGEALSVHAHSGSSDGSMLATWLAACLLALARAAHAQRRGPASSAATPGARAGADAAVKPDARAAWDRLSEIVMEVLARELHQQQAERSTKQRGRHIRSGVSSSLVLSRRCIELTSLLLRSNLLGDGAAARVQRAMWSLPLFDAAVSRVGCRARACFASLHSFALAPMREQNQTKENSFVHSFGSFVVFPDALQRAHSHETTSMHQPSHRCPSRRSSRLRRLSSFRRSFATASCARRAAKRKRATPPRRRCARSRSVAPRSSSGRARLSPAPLTTRARRWRQTRRCGPRRRSCAQCSPASFRSGRRRCRASQHPLPLSWCLLRSHSRGCAPRAAPPSRGAILRRAATSAPLNRSR